jgi:hypothetical protein
MMLEIWLPGLFVLGLVSMGLCGSAGGADDCRAGFRRVLTRAPEICVEVFEPA